MTQPGFNPFTGTTNAKPTGSGNYIKPGLHDLEIESVKYLPSSQKANTAFYIVEFKVLGSNGGHAPGEKVSWLVNMANQPALGAIKGFLVAALNAEDEKEIDDNVALASTHADQPCKGVVVKCQAIQIKTKKGTDFTKCTFEHLRQSA